MTIRSTQNAQRWIRGFTLIELLVVVAIIGLLASTVFASIRLGRLRSRDAKRKADLRQVQLGLQFYLDKFGHYPVTDDGGGGQGQGKGKGKGKKNGQKKGTTVWQFSTDSDYWIGCNECYDEEGPESLKEFLNRLPQDPRTTAPDPRVSGHYSYGYYSLTGDDYELIAQLEDTADAATCASRCWLSHEQDPGKAWCPVCPNPNLNYSNFLYTDH